MAGELESLGFDLVRRIHTVLAMHFLEGKKQSEISALLNLSTAKVNRLIKQGRELGMVQISINSPYQRLVDLEQELIARWPLDPALVVPAITDNPTTTLGQVGAAAASLLLDAVRDGDTIAISGGKAVRATIECLSADGHLDVNVVPMTGGVQGQHYTDVNHLATLLAERLGGQATLIHAPLFAETSHERDMLMSVRSVSDVFDAARNAAIALVGIGSVAGEQSTYYEAHPMVEDVRRALANSNVRGEFLGHLIDVDGRLSDIEFNSRLVALPPGEAARIPTTVGVVSGAEKVGPLRAVLGGTYINALVLDEETARGVLQLDIEGA
jgi:DNA-binding transcriptional regulator LsrR (DeoR family)